MARGEKRASLGRKGEDAACRYLEGQGFEIADRNFRTRSGEIDIVARKEGLLVFAEVKARRTTSFGEPEEAVTPSKVRRIRALASEYLSQGDSPAEVRFDVISVMLDREGNQTELRHIPAAF